MPGDTITRAQLSEAVYEEVGLSRNESAELVEAVLEEMVSSLTEGETVKISSFGSFSSVGGDSFRGFWSKIGGAFSL